MWSSSQLHCLFATWLTSSCFWSTCQLHGCFWEFYFPFLCLSCWYGLISQCTWRNLEEYLYSGLCSRSPVRRSLAENTAQFVITLSPKECITARHVISVYSTWTITVCGLITVSDCTIESFSCSFWSIWFSYSSMYFPNRHICSL